MQYTGKRRNTNSSSNAKADIVVEDLLRRTSKWTVDVKPDNKHSQKYKQSQPRQYTNKRYLKCLFTLMSLPSTQWDLNTFFPGL